jgi:hypothetical protein
MNTLKLRCTLAVAIVCVFAVPAVAADDASHAVMEHWVGSWTGTAVGDDAAGSTGAPARAEAAWTLGEQFVQGTNYNAAGEPVGVWLMKYDADDNEYDVYYFAMDGSVSEWEGKWSDADRTMTWEGEDDVTGTDLTGYTKFVDGRQEWKLDLVVDGKATPHSGTLTKQ